MKNVTFSHTLEGFIVGKAWGGFKGSIPISRKLYWTSPVFHLPSIVQNLLTQLGGDFQNPLFDKDAFIKVEMRWGSTGNYKVKIRHIPLIKFAAELINPDSDDYIPEEQLYG